MHKISSSCARTLRRVLWEYGRDWGRDAWLSRMEDAPRAEAERMPEGYYVTKKEDDGLGDVSWELKTALLSALHMEMGRFLLIVGNPDTSEDDGADAANDAANISSYIKWVGEWPAQ